MFLRLRRCDCHNKLRQSGTSRKSTSISYDSGKNIFSFMLLVSLLGEKHIIVLFVMTEGSGFGCSAILSCVIRTQKSNANKKNSGLPRENIYVVYRSIC